jgi:hypothetical protein
MHIGRVLAAAGFLAIAAAGPASACSCAQLNAERLMQDATAIFTGLAEGTAPVQPGWSVTTFRVTEGFKGARRGNTVRVHHRSGSSASCGVQFARGAAHTLYAQAQNGTLSASLCTAWGFRSGGGPALIARLRELRGR